MVKGQPAVVWNAEQDTKLLYAILEIYSIEINYNTVAKAFGNDVPGRCISFHISQLRKKARELGLAPQAAVNSSSSTLYKSILPPGKATKTSAPRTSASKQLSLKRRRRGLLTSDSDKGEDHMSSEASEDEHVNAKRFRTAPNTPSRQTSIVGNITKPRISPRNLIKKDYRAIEDPFGNSGACDTDGYEIFEKSAEEEETLASNEEYSRAEGGVKLEEEMAVYAHGQSASTVLPLLPLSILQRMAIDRDAFS